MGKTISNNKYINYSDLRKGYLNDKTTLGCGGTTAIILSDESNIIFVPNTSNVSSKLDDIEKNWNGSRLVSTPNVVKFNTPSGKTKYIIGISGEFDSKDVKKTVREFDQNGMLYSVVCVYDSSHNILPYAKNTTHVWIDEVHIFTKSYRTNAFLSLEVKLSVYGFSYSGISATINRDNLPEFLAKLPVHKIEFPNFEPMEVTLINVNRPEEYATKALSQFVAENESTIFGVNGVSKVLVGYNSMNGICTSTLNSKGALNASNTTLVASVKAGGDNVAKADEVGFAISAPSMALSTKVTFATSCLYQGVDVRGENDENALHVLILDTKNKFSRLDICDIVQFSGRIRNSKINKLIVIANFPERVKIGSDYVSIDDYIEYEAGKVDDRIAIANMLVGKTDNSKYISKARTLDMANQGGLSFAVELDSKVRINEYAVNEAKYSIEVMNMYKTPSTFVAALEAQNQFKSVVVVNAENEEKAELRQNYSKDRLIEAVAKSLNGEEVNKVLRGVANEDKGAVRVKQYVTPEEMKDSKYNYKKCVGMAQLRDYAFKAHVAYKLKEDGKVKYSLKEAKETIKAIGAKYFNEGFMASVKGETILDFVEGEVKRDNSERYILITSFENEVTAIVEERELTTTADITPELMREFIRTTEAKPESKQEPKLGVDGTEIFKYVEGSIAWDCGDDWSQDNF